MVEFFIAKKHIFERKRQSLISTLGIAIGVIVLIVSIGIANGLDKNMISSILSMTSHVLVENGDKLSDYNDLKERIEKIPGVKGAVPSIETQGIFKYNGIYGGYISGVKIEGFDLESAKKAMNLDKKIVEGSISPDKMNGILIGKELFKNIGASLGDESIAQSKQAAIFAMILIGVFMIVFYKLPGIVANIALIIFGLITFGCLNFIDATLTLPGIAGLILSAGMAVDANVIIFERIKEELRLGNTIRNAIDAGFSKGFVAIFDSNLTTLIITVILFTFGTGPVKGFAVTLTIGTLASMFTAITITKILLLTFITVFNLNRPELFGVRGKTACK